MGDLFSGSTKTTSTEQHDTGPSKFQAPYLSGAFDAAQANFNSQNGTPYYQGETYAGLSADQKAQLERLKGFAIGQGADASSAISGVGTGLINDTSGKATSNLDRFTQLAGTDATQSNIDAAMQYADNPFVNSQIDAASRDISRNLSENTLPSIDRAAAGSGNINSSRAGVASGIAQRGAADRIGDISASIRGDAYNRGIAQASADRASTLDAYRDAAGSYANLTGQGIDALSAGTNMGYQNLAAEQAAGATEQADRQGQLTSDFERWKGDDTRQQDLLERYMSIIGSNQWGQSGTSSGTNTQKTSGNIFGQLAGAAATAASFIP